MLYLQKNRYLLKIYGNFCNILSKLKLALHFPIILICASSNKLILREKIYIYNLFIKLKQSKFQQNCYKVRYFLRLVVKRHNKVVFFHIDIQDIHEISRCLDTPSLLGFANFP